MSKLTKLISDVLRTRKRQCKNYMFSPTMPSSVQEHILFTRYKILQPPSELLKRPVVFARKELQLLRLKRNLAAISPVSRQVKLIHHLFSLEVKNLRSSAGHINCIMFRPGHNIFKFSNPHYIPSYVALPFNINGKIILESKIKEYLVRFTTQI